jgi:hypothetical protein
MATAPPRVPRSPSDDPPGRQPSNLEASEAPWPTRGRASEYRGPPSSAASVAPPDLPAAAVGNSATVSSQLWLPESIWRPTAGWAVAAALLAYGLLTRSFFVDWRGVALALLLADPLWGSIWRLAGGRNALLPLRQEARSRAFWLPYLRPDSPAARLMGWRTSPGDERDGIGALPLAFRVGLPTLVVPLAIGWVLSVQAVWLTAAVIVLSGLGWIGRHFLPAPPAILQSLVTITLPWILMLSLLNISSEHELFGLHVALLVLWTIHHWGETRVSRLPASATGPHAPYPDLLGVGLLAVADLGMGALLIVAQTPLWLAPLAILWLPTYLTLYQGKRVDRLAFWWLAAMLLSSAAIGSRMV